MTLSEISKIFGVGISGIRYLLQRESVDTMLNKFNKKIDLNSLTIRFSELRQLGFKKMKIYEILSNESGLSKGYLAKLKI